MKGLIYTYLTTYGGAVVSLFYPLVGILIYINFAIFEPPALWYWSVPSGNYARIIAIAALVGWGFHGFGNWDLRRAWLPTGMILAFLFWCMASTVFAAVPPIGWAFVNRFLKILLPLLAGLTLINSLRDLKALARVLVYSQGYLAYEFNLSYYEGFNRVYEAGFAGMDNNAIAIAMATGVGLSFFLGLHERAIWLKVPAFLAAALEAHVIMFSFSRGGMLALIVVGVVAFLLVPKRPIHVLIFVLAVMLGFRLAGEQVRERFMTVFVDPEERDASAQSRVEMWKDCFDVMRRKPVFGAGPDHWGLVAVEYGWPRGKEAHSLWFQTGAETGFAGVAFLLGFYFFTIWRLWKFLWPNAPPVDPFVRDAARMVIASLAGFGVAAQFVTIEGLELPYYVTLLGMGALKLGSPLPPLVRPGMYDEPAARPEPEPEPVPV
jgi:probable O-glycosylation ligase (exosortase A-associated)